MLVGSKPLALLALGLLAETGLPARPPTPLTRASVSRMAPEALNRRLFGEMSGLMFRIPGFGRSVDWPDQPLQWLHFLTRPFTTEEAGVCGTTHLTVYFQPIGTRRGARTTVRPWRIVTEQNYFLLDRTRILRAEPIGESERTRLDSACAAQDPRNTHWFTAPDSAYVGEATRLVADLVAAARQGRTTGPLDCTPLAEFGEAPVDQAACLRIIAHLDPTRIWEVGYCDAAPICIRVVVDDGNAISFERQAGGPAPIRITVAPNIIVTA